MSRYQKKHPPNHHSHQSWSSSSFICSSIYYDPWHPPRSVIITKPCNSLQPILPKFITNLWEYFIKYFQNNTISNSLISYQRHENIPNCTCTMLLAYRSHILLTGRRRPRSKSPTYYTQCNYFHSLRKNLV